ncbi:MAG: hypothetical protein M3018_08745 [Actinomycetota bacterium]|nr:hypothetical protein [Actinomycetota bacterium]
MPPEADEDAPAEPDEVVLAVADDELVPEPDEAAVLRAVVLVVGEPPAVTVRPWKA